MADIATLVQRYLTIEPKPKRLNYYSVLGLEEFIDDRSAITVAVEAAIEKLKSADRAKDPTGFEQVVKVIRQARATLLDEEKKRAYDHQLKASLAKPPASPSPIEPAPNEMSRLSAVLPHGDPKAPFSMSEYLKQSVDQVEAETAAQRHIALAEIVRSSMQVPASPPTLERLPSQPAFKSSGGLLDATNVPGSRSAGRELQQMIRRNRQRKNMIAASLAIGSSMIVVLIGVWMFIANRIEQQRQIAKNTSQSSLANAFQPAPWNDPLGPTTTDTDRVSGEPVKTRMNLGVTTSSNQEPLGPLPQIGDDSPPSVTTPAIPVAVPTEADAASPPLVEKPLTNADSMNETKAVDLQATKEDAAKWAAAMTAARKTLDEKNFERFENEIENALNLSATDEQEARTRLLDTFGQLYQKGLSLATEAFASLKATDEIKYGTAGGKASVVESANNQLILRISGKNEKFSYDKIPLGIWMAVLEAKLNDSAVDQAIRAVMLSIDPRSNSANKKQASSYFEKAASMDASFAKLESILQETYQ